MSERERWIVYPLLFLTLGIVFTDKVSSARFQEVRCNKIIASSAWFQEVRCNKIIFKKLSDKNSNVREIELDFDVIERWLRNTRRRN